MQQPQGYVTQQPQGYAMQPQQQFVVPQPVTIVPQQQETDDKLQPSAKSQMLVLSVIQMVMGILCIIFGITLVPLSIDSYFEGSDLGVIGYGIWIGALYLVVGGVGLGASKNNTNGWITGAMIMNILCSALWCFPLLGMASTSLAISSSSLCNNFYVVGLICNKVVHNTFMAMDSLMVLMAIAQFIITIWSAALCCGAVCRCCKPALQTQHVVQYNGQQQMAVYPSVPSYGMGQVTVVQQGHYAAQVHGATPTGGYMAAPQGPPSYYAQGTGGTPATAYPTEVPGEGKH